MGCILLVKVKVKLTINNVGTLYYRVSIVSLGI